MFERVVFGYVRRVSGWVVAATALAFYPGIGLLLPMWLDLSGSWFISVNLLAATAAAVLGMGWLAIQLEASHRRHLVDWTTNLRLLTSEEFEWLAGEVFRREGWAVRETGHQDRSDGNIDLELTRGRETRLVQCKRWQAWQVQVGDIRAFAGTLLREGINGAHGTFVTLSTFNRYAEEEARRMGMELIDGRQLYERIEAVRRAEPCPVCGQAMTLDRSPHGWWFRCVTAGCKGKKDLGAEAARVVDLLTEPSASSGGG